MICPRSSGRPILAASEYGVSRPTARWLGGEDADGSTTAPTQDAVVEARSCTGGDVAARVKGEMLPNVAVTDSDETRMNRTSHRTQGQQPRELDFSSHLACLGQNWPV